MTEMIHQSMPLCRTLGWWPGPSSRTRSAWLVAKVTQTQAVLRPRS